MAVATAPSQLDFSNTQAAFASRSDARMRKMRWLFGLMNNPQLVQLGTWAAVKSLQWGLPVQWAIRATIFEQFVGGENIAQCMPVVQQLGDHGIGSILDYSVEGEKNEAAFDATMRETVATIAAAAGHPHIPFSVFKVTGLARMALLEKVQAGQALAPAEQAEWERVQQRVATVCQAAAQHQVRLFFDGEETWIQNVIDDLCLANMALHNQQRPLIFNTYQLYRRAALGLLQQHLQVAARQGFFFGAKLVRGAYMEKERERAARLGQPDPMQPDKQATDHDYNAALLLCLDNLHYMALCAGTHNETSCLLLASEMQRRGLQPADERVWFSQLYGMSDHISYNLSAAGYRVAKYLPYGPLAAVMPYLVRRARENTSIAGQTSRELQLIGREIARRQAARA